MQATSSRSWLTVIGLVVAVPIAALFALSVAYNLYVLATGDGSAWFLPMSALALAGSLIAVAGLLVVRRYPVIGAALAVAGSAIFGGTWWWFGAGEVPLLGGIVLFLPLSIIGVARAWQEISVGHPRTA